MNKIFTFWGCLLLSALSLTTSAQQGGYPDSLNAYYRLAQPASGQYFTAFSAGALGVSSPDPARASQVIRLSTTKMYSLADDMAALQAQLESGEIDQDTYNRMFQQIMTLNSWKSGFYPVTHLRSQGTDYALLMASLKTYCDRAINDFLNDEVPGIYNQYYQTLLMLSVFSGVIYPANLATVDDFKAWCNNYLSQWRDIADFRLYLHPITATQEGDDTPNFTGNYAVEFKTPAWIGNMKNAQTYINAILTNNGANPDVDTLDIWQSAVEHVLAEVAKDYAEESEQYKLADNLFNYTKADMVYALSTDENGDLYAQPLPDAFDTNGVTLTDDQAQRLVWHPEDVDESSPFAVAPDAAKKGSDGHFYTTLNTAFPYKVLSPDVEVYTVSSVDAATGGVTLDKIADGKVGANTAVVVRSKSTDLADNQLVPLDEDVAPIDGNVLGGTLFAQNNNGSMKTLTVANDQPAFLLIPETVPANTAFYEGKVANGIGSLHNTFGRSVVFDLQGRKVATPQQKGVYIINGQKVVVR
ncbi:MAG: hypothetical protein SOY06_07045 [Prevotella sp.]|nr:hypothetical protein [Bacteroidales bacterium]MDY4229586.1 hypothetical protein [Prevotella sp.]